jgi:hypothetical protein
MKSKIEKMAAEPADSKTLPKTKMSSTAADDSDR